MALTVNHPLLKEQTVTATTGTFGTPASAFTIAPFRGKIVKLRVVNSVALLTADQVVTCKINGTAVTGGIITVPFTGNVAGTVTTIIPSGANAVNEDDTIEFAYTGNTTTGFAAFQAVVQAG